MPKGMRREGRDPLAERGRLEVIECLTMGYDLAWYGAAFSKEGTPFRRGLRIWMRTGAGPGRLEIIVRVSFRTAAVPLRLALSP